MSFDSSLAQAETLLGTYEMSIFAVNKTKPMKTKANKVSSAFKANAILEENTIHINSETTQ